MKLKKKLSREFSGTDAFTKETRLTPNALNSQLTLIENSYLAGFEKAREMAANQVRVEPFLPKEANCLEFRILNLGEEDGPDDTRT